MGNCLSSEQNAQAEADVQEEPKAKKIQNQTRERDKVASPAAREEALTETVTLPDLDPNTNYLLPAQLAEHEGKKTLVLDLDETIVHSTFKPTRNPDFIVPISIDNVVHRVYVQIRPYLNEFLVNVSKDYEIIVFAAGREQYVRELVDKLDVHKVITHQLYRDSCSWYNDSYFVKDLRRLGRKMEDIVLLDDKPQSWMFQPKNAIRINTWFDDMNDTQLRDIIPCLKTTLKNASDVREILDANTRSFRWVCDQAGKNAN